MILNPVAWVMSDQPPWPKGSHPDFEAFVIEVHIRKERSGALRSLRRLQDTVDESVALKMGPSGGMVEGSLALLTEAARTEAMLQSLVNLSHDKTLRDRILSEDEEQKKYLVQSLIQDTSAILHESLAKIIHQVCEETLDQIRAGIKS